MKAILWSKKGKLHYVRIDGKNYIRIGEYTFINPRDCEKIHISELKEKIRACDEITHL